MLFGKSNISNGVFIIELNAPARLCLLSSYSKWNELLEAVIQQHSLADDIDQWEAMFTPPLLKHEGDDIQGVLPYLNMTWVDSIRPLIVAGRHSTDLL